tara:strand:+ start:25 stop:162 length:138 start_codon:yes stop_codon:yes gene_type:complete
LAGEDLDEDDFNDLLKFNNLDHELDRIPISGGVLRLDGYAAYMAK